MPIPKTYQKVEAEVTVEGTVLSGAFTLADLKVQHEVNRIPSALVRLYDGDAPSGSFELSSGKKPELVPGAKVKISFRIPESAKVIPVFEGILISQSIRVYNHRSLLILECKSEAIKMTLGRHFTSFTDQKDSEVLGKIIQDSSLTPTVSATKIKHPTLIQYDCCDWDFMMMRAEANGYLALVKSNAIALGPPDFSQKSNLDLVFPNGIHRVDLRVDARTQLDQSKAFSWNPKKQEANMSQAKAPLKPVPDLPGNMKAVDLAKAMGKPSWELFHPGALPKDQLLSWAQGRMLKSRMARIQGSLSTYGFDIVPGKSIQLKGLGDRFNGEAFIAGVTQHYQQGEWTTELKFGLPEGWYVDALNGPKHPGNSNHNQLPGLTTATVVKIDKDPASEFGVQVRLWIGDGGTLVWARMAFPEAGADRGLVGWPDVDDEVVLGFMGGDPAFPVVIGTLFSSKNKPPFKPDAENQQRGWVTKEGVSLTFDDAEKSVALATKGGYTVSINEGKKELFAKDGNGNEIKLSKSGISMTSNKKIELDTKDKITLSALKGIEIKASTGDLSLKGKNIMHNATMKFSASGNSGAEMTTPAIATLKGMLVKIN